MKKKIAMSTLQVYIFIYSLQLCEAVNSNEEKAPVKKHAQVAGL